MHRSAHREHWRRLAQSALQVPLDEVLPQERASKAHHETQARIVALQQAKDLKGDRGSAGGEEDPEENEFKDT